MGKKNNIRRTIRMLQEIPLVISVVVFLVYFTNLFGNVLAEYIYPLFGFSFYIMLRLYMVAKGMYVQKWSRVLYITLMIISLIEFVDNIISVPLDVLFLQEIIEIMFVIGVISSFITFLYGKYKKFRKQCN